MDNNYAGFLSDTPNQDINNQPDFAARLARAYQAYYEHIPLRAAQLPTWPYLQLYRRLTFGSLISINVMDTVSAVPRWSRRRHNGPLG